MEIFHTCANRVRVPNYHKAISKTWVEDRVGDRRSHKWLHQNHSQQVVPIHLLRLLTKTLPRRKAVYSMMPLTKRSSGALGRLPGLIYTMNKLLQGPHWCYSLCTASWRCSSHVNWLWSSTAFARSSAVLDLSAHSLPRMGSSPSFSEVKVLISFVRSLAVQKWLPTAQCGRGGREVL